MSKRVTRWFAKFADDSITTYFRTKEEAFFAYVDAVLDAILASDDVTAIRMSMVNGEGFRLTNARAIVEKDKLLSDELERKLFGKASPLNHTKAWKADDGSVWSTKEEAEDSENAGLSSKITMAWLESLEGQDYDMLVMNLQLVLDHPKIGPLFADLTVTAALKQQLADEAAESGTEAESVDDDAEVVVDEAGSPSP